jgi:acyl phosphate:glycerol-3-phosphate acyltransferase
MTALIYQTAGVSLLRIVAPRRREALLHSKPDGTMPLSLYLIVVSVAYLLGSIPFGFLLVLLVRKEDIRAKGSGNIGATNVLRSGAKGLGILTFVLDGSKGYAAVAVAEFLTRNAGPAVLQNAALLAGLFAILGHMFPAWLRFKGGKGVATAFGVFLALCPLAALSAFVLWLAVVALTRYVSLASILAAVVLPFLTLWLSPANYSYAFRPLVFACCWVVIVKHRENILRLLHGTEHRFGASRKTVV